jgi:hypothetical protein
MDNTNGSITVSKGATTFAGPAGVDVFRANLLKSSLRLFAKTGIIPTRGVSGSKLLKLATQYTGITYKAGAKVRESAEVAARDLEAVVSGKLEAIKIEHN